jgi:thermostable 8-oxoguanine DNA glycosylase
MKTKVDPKNITNFNRTDGELESFMVFSIAVAGKNANQTANLIGKVLGQANSDESPFQFLRRIPLDDHLRFWRVGQYRRILPALEGVMRLDLRTCTMGDLLKVHGIGPKTANMFLLHSRPNHQGAVLDTHILRWMREIHGVKTPKQTPSGKRYDELEKTARELISESFPQMSLADADLLIWKTMSGNNDE